MDHAKYIGRVGALAVALGIGMAVATTPGVAWASPDGENNPRRRGCEPPEVDRHRTPLSRPTSRIPPMPSRTRLRRRRRRAPSRRRARPERLNAAQSPTETTVSNATGPEVIVRSSGGALTSGQNALSLPALQAPVVVAPTTASTPQPADVISKPTTPTSPPAVLTPNTGARQRLSPPPAAFTPPTAKTNPFAAPNGLFRRQPHRDARSCARHRRQSRNPAPPR